MPKQRRKERTNSCLTTAHISSSHLPSFLHLCSSAYSALKRDGKKLYELGRQGQTAEDLKIEPREVIIYDLKLVGYNNESGENGNDDESKPIEKFFIDVECGGGTYIRSLVRDIGIALGTVATMTKLERTKQGQFLMEHSLPYSSDDSVTLDENGGIVINKREDCNWTVAAINKAIRTCRETLLISEDDGLKDK
jgi:tRNA pseudouridine(55) synthase